MIIIYNAEVYVPTNDRWMVLKVNLWSHSTWLSLQIVSFLEQYDKTCLPEHMSYFLVWETEHALSVRPLAHFDSMTADGSKVQCNTMGGWEDG